MKSATRSQKNGERLEEDESIPKERIDGSLGFFLVGAIFKRGRGPRGASY